MTFALRAIKAMRKHTPSTRSSHGGRFESGSASRFSIQYLKERRPAQVRGRGRDDASAPNVHNWCVVPRVGETSLAGFGRSLRVPESQRSVLHLFKNLSKVRIGYLKRLRYREGNANSQGLWSGVGRYAQLSAPSPGASVDTKREQRLARGVPFARSSRLAHTVEKFTKLSAWEMQASFEQF